MKMRQSNSVNICNPKTLIGKRRKRIIVLYSLAINDSHGLSTRAFGDEEPVLLWLAEHAEGPDDAERLELHRLAQEPAKLPFWRFLRNVTPPYVEYRLQCHTLTLGGAR
jgi:hypothetical protein